jgi:cob(I)alamin adenosyltransferase
MKIYTKTGDKGTTSLIGGKRVPKYHNRIEAYGTVDELIASVSLVRDYVTDPHIKEILLETEDRLMTCASILAADCNDCMERLPVIKESDLTLLENEIDQMEVELKPLKSFILPGGHPLVSHCHVARTVCRRAERVSNKLASETFVPEPVLRYLNRLSDYLFVLARKLSKDLNINEIPWIPKLEI